MWRSILTLAISLFTFCLTSLTAHAELANYGYLVGTFVPGSNALEKVNQQGTYMHYVFYVNGESGTTPYRSLSILKA